MTYEPDELVPDDDALDALPAVVLDGLELDEEEPHAATINAAVPANSKNASPRIRRRPWPTRSLTSGIFFSSGLRSDIREIVSLRSRAELTISPVSTIKRLGRSQPKLKLSQFRYGNICRL